MSAPMLHLTLSENAEPLSIAINRIDVAPGEPAALQKWHDLKPGESLKLPLHPGCLISIAERRDG